MDISKVLEKIKSRGYWEIEIKPAIYGETKLKINQCMELVEKCQVRNRGWYYPAISNKNDEFFAGNDCYVGLTDWQDHVEAWKFYQSGQFVHYLGLWEDYIGEYRGLFGNRDSRSDQFPPNTILEIIMTLYTLTEAFLFASRLASNNVYGDSMIFSLKLHNVKNRRLHILETGRYLNREYVCQIESIELPEKIITVNDILENHAKIALDTTLEIFERFNWKYDEQSIREVLTKDQEKFFKMQF